MSSGYRIMGLGSFSPEKRVGAVAFPEALGSDVAEFRHHAGSDEGSIAMGLAAARAALENANLPAQELDGAIVFSGMPDYEYPKDGNAILRELGAARAVCWHLDTACASFITGLETARLRIESGHADHILVLMIMNWVGRGVDRSRDFSSVGDGAAAVIVGKDDSGQKPCLGIREATHGEHFGYLELRSPFATGQSEVFRFGADAGHGRFLMSGCLDVPRQLFHDTRTTPDSIDWMVAHQPGTRLPKIWARGLGIAPERVLSTFHAHANMSAVNIPMTLAHHAGGRCLHGSAVLAEPQKDQKILPGHRLLFFAPGAGLHVAAMLWVW